MSETALKTIISYGSDGKQRSLGRHAKREDALAARRVAVEKLLSGERI